MLRELKQREPIQPSGMISCLFRKNRGTERARGSCGSTREDNVDLYDIGEYPEMKSESIPVTTHLHTCLKAV